MKGDLMKTVKKIAVYALGLGVGVVGVGAVGLLGYGLLKLSVMSVPLLAGWLSVGTTVAGTIVYTAAASVFAGAVLAVGRGLKNWTLWTIGKIKFDSVRRDMGEHLRVINERENLLRKIGILLRQEEDLQEQLADLGEQIGQISELQRGNSIEITGDSAVNRSKQDIVKNIKVREILEGMVDGDISDKVRKIDEVCNSTERLQEIIEEQEEQNKELEKQKEELQKSKDVEIGGRNSIGKADEPQGEDKNKAASWSKEI